MPSMVEIICKCGCSRKKLVRTADVKRGWGKFFSKSCKAIHQEKQYKIDIAEFRGDTGVGSYYGRKKLYALGDA